MSNWESHLPVRQEERYASRSTSLLSNATERIMDCDQGGAMVEPWFLLYRGTGRQSSLMWTNLAGFWGVGMPICYYLAFVKKYGVQGLWIGLVIGLSVSGETHSLPPSPSLSLSLSVPVPYNCLFICSQAMLTSTILMIVVCASCL